MNNLLGYFLLGIEFILLLIVASKVCNRISNWSDSMINERDMELGVSEQ